MASDATAPLAPGPLLTLTHGTLAVDVAPQAGGRLAQIRRGGAPLLVDHAAASDAAIA